MATIMYQNMSTFRPLFIVMLKFQYSIFDIFKTMGKNSFFYVDKTLLFDKIPLKLKMAALSKATVCLNLFNLNAVVQILSWWTLWAPEWICDTRKHQNKSTKPFWTTMEWSSLDIWHHKVNTRQYTYILSIRKSYCVCSQLTKNN